MWVDYLDKNIGPVIVIIVTVLAAFANFLVYDNSGIIISDITLEEIDDSNIYNLTFYMRNGRNFNLLKFEQLIYNPDGKILYNNSSMLNKMYSGSHTYQENISFNKTELPSTIEFKVYDSVNSTNESFKLIYNKKINLTK